MSISHWGIVPGWFEPDTSTGGLASVRAVWRAADFDTWCREYTREPIREIK